MRIILYLGKGGVGKTTTAAATALRSAQLGYKTLVASTDIAHSLADSLDIDLSHKPVRVAENLWAQEISAIADMVAYWDVLQEYVAGFVASDKGLDRVMADELSAIPGMDEIVALLHINKQAKDADFDRVIIDAAPTGETIRLLTLPDTFRWYAAQAFRFQGRISKSLKPLAGRFLQGPMDVLNALEKLDAATAELRETLSDPEITSYRVVVQPEKMVVREAQRAVSYLGLFNYPVDSVVVNRVLPEMGDEGEFYQKRYEIQQKHLRYIEDSFRPIPIWTAPYYAHEVVGLKALAQLATDCFGDADPGQIFYTGMLQEVVELEDGAYMLRLPLPFVSGGDVTLRKRGDEMFITVGNFKREMILPTVLAKRRTRTGRLVDGVLEIEFAPLHSEPLPA
ncbi:MAG: TRC40/GET3/ArsA family transport-energizing ATPase [Anaerolineae bacterium]|nr:TRC40/GET3/ArsA family transport-energizing ATPase [Anaerolineae bacterium]MCO5192264.1 TRC40/GET3/ArsA family transport-energizing ATPase [Anaerolineae bacterium]MCO5204146.1 TRC40/GET3/ArsA family transport-energizing ATPase [Anaerolineae bacterium]